MRLTDPQLRSLKLLRLQRSKPLTTVDFIKASWLKYVLTLLFIAAAITVLALTGFGLMAVFFGGYLFGLVERDVIWIRNQLKVLPITSEITNWERVEQPIEENEA